MDSARTLKAFVEVDVGDITYTALTNGIYVTELRQGTFFSCTCPDFTMRGSLTGTACKHAIRLGITIGLDIVRWDEICENMKALVGEEDGT